MHFSSKNGIADEHMSKVKRVNNLTEKTVQNLLGNYSSKYDYYKDYSENISKLLALFLKIEKINFHSITFRTKEIYSLKQKIRRKSLAGKFYKNLDDISDLSGVRIILFFNADLSRVIEIIEKEFFVFVDENLDKPFAKILSENDSGYTSTHRIVKHGKSREKLKEYKYFSGMKCEIQVRTVLQHAWAEIEHGIGYKNNISRKLSSKIVKQIFKDTSKLLNEADDNFSDIRAKHNQILDKIYKQIENKNLNLSINPDSLEVYLNKIEKFNDMQDSKRNFIIINYMKLCRDLGFKIIKDLDSFLS